MTFEQLGLLEFLIRRLDAFQQYLEFSVVSLNARDELG